MMALGVEWTAKRRDAFYDKYTMIYGIYRQEL